MHVGASDVEPIEFSGLVIRDYTASLDAGASLASIDVPAGVAHALSWSTRSDKYYLVTHGRIRFELDGADTEMGPGDFCLVRKGQKFRYLNSGPEPARLVLVHQPAFELEAEVFAPDDG